LKTFEDGADQYNELIVVSGIPVYSHCEHHLAPFFRTAAIGYVPDGKIVGLSKLTRLVDCFARAPLAGAGALGDADCRSADAALVAFVGRGRHSLQAHVHGKPRDSEIRRKNNDVGALGENSPERSSAQ